MEKLLNLLERQQHTLNELIGVTKQEQEAIIAHNVDCVRASIKQKEELQRQLVELEKERQMLTAESRLSNLAVAAGDKKALLDALHHSLKNSLQELKTLNITNTLLIKTELAYFDFLKEKVFSTTKQYNDKGTLNSKPQDSNAVVSHLA
ncbi:MAG: flagellar protein FlgN [Firmicutes bacterium]|nr:flagellar protein FlgN [Bacillota bacterium]